MRNHRIVARWLLAVSLLAIAASADAAPLKHGTGFTAPGQITRWLTSVGSSSVVSGRLNAAADPFVAGLSGRAFDAAFDARYGTGAHSRWKWVQYDNEAKANTIPAALAWACLSRPDLLGIAAGTYDCVATTAEIEDCAAVGCPIPSYWNASALTGPTNAANAVPIDDPSKPCGYFVAPDVFFGGSRTYYNLSLPPRCAAPSGTPAPTNPGGIPPAAPPSTGPIAPPVTPLPGPIDCVSWWTSFETWLAGGSPPTAPPPTCRGVRRSS